MSTLNPDIHALLATWAADCAEHVLHLFEQHHQHDDRPRKAIEAARAWVRGDVKMMEARGFAFAAHAAAREAKDEKAIAAARAAGHAAATAHVYTHAQYAAAYALKAVDDAETEKAWQAEQLPEVCKTIVATAGEVKPGDKS